VVLWWYGGIPNDEGSPPALPDGSRPLTPEHSDGEQAASGGRGPLERESGRDWGILPRQQLRSFGRVRMTRKRKAKN